MYKVGNEQAEVNVGFDCKTHIRKDVNNCFKFDMNSFSSLFTKYKNGFIVGKKLLFKKKLIFHNNVFVWTKHKVNEIDRTTVFYQLKSL